MLRLSKCEKLRWILMALRGDAMMLLFSMHQNHLLIFFAFKCKWIRWLVDPIVTGVVTCFHILIAPNFLHCCLHFRYRAIDPLSLWSCHSNVAKMFETNLFENEPKISVTAERSDKKNGFHVSWQIWISMENGQIGAVRVFFFFLL